MNPENVLSWADCCGGLQRRMAISKLAQQTKWRSAPFASACHLVPRRASMSTCWCSTWPPRQCWLSSGTLAKAICISAHVCRAGPNMSSMLAQRVAINKLADSFMAFNTNYQDAGLFGVYAVCSDPSTIDDLVRRSPRT